MRRSVRLGFTLALGSAPLVGFGCGASSAESRAVVTPPDPRAGAKEQPRTLLRDASWERIRVAALALTLELPDATRFREHGSANWAKLEHAASGSRLELSLSRAERLVRPEDCEARARLAHPELPRPAEGEALDQRRVSAPRDFLTQVTVSVSEAGSSELEGHVTAFGAAVGRCFALHFVTRVGGAGAEDELAHRLGMVVERVLPSISLSAVDERVSPEPFPRMKRP